ncbi:MAG TPA: DUF433 domain-containing protein [Thermoanaerobaculia bacterium]|jgi:uncharacterized protein (DUF433 family)|nr:DUF433 domain-containing protein [Thermoanaerobaculia bacterium]
MAQTALNLPPQLKEDAERLASRQGISLDQFIVWAVAEKVGGLKQGLDDPRFPGITYRRGAAGWPEPVIRGTGLHVRTLVVEHHVWNLSVSDIADNHDLTEEQILEALAFFEAHRSEIEAAIAENGQYEPANA